MWRYFQGYYRINRQVWPDMTRVGAALDSLRVVFMIRVWRKSGPTEE